MWFAGESVNYYYGGHLAASLLARLTATPPAYAYNLALAGFYATLVTAAFELARGVAAGRATDRGASAASVRAHGVRAGLAAAFFVGLASNLVTAGRVALTLLPDGPARRVAGFIAARSRVDAAELLAGTADFYYWTASRVVPGTINEFPLFGFLNGDLHAHMMAAPFLLLGAGLAHAYWRTPAAARRRRRLLVFGAVPVLAGTLVVVHTWDFPTVLGVAWLTLAFAPATPLTLLPRGSALVARLRGRLGTGVLATEIERTGGALLVVAVAGALGFLVGSPFLLGATTGQEPALLAPADRSTLGPLLVVHGAFLAAFLAYLFGRLLPGERGRDATEPGAGGGAASAGSGGWSSLLVGLFAVAVAGLLADFAAIAVVVPLLGLGWATLRLGRDVGFETVLLVGGAGLVGLVEVVYVAEQAGPGRLNTVFKVYFQVWTLWGVAVGVALAELWAHGFTGVRDAVGGAMSESAATAVDSTDDDVAGDNPTAGGPTTDDVTADGSGATEAADPGPPGRIRARLPAGETLARLFVVALVLLTVPYAGLALDSHFERHDVGTLNATTFADREHPGEMRAIRWLDSRATREDTLLSAPGTSGSPEGLATNPGTPGMYDWRANPASSLTGIPTVAGWAHEVGYRGVAPYDDRVADVDRAYAGSDAERAAVLAEYEVTYVWVGPTERARYGDLAFEDLQGVEVAYETETVTVYRVDQDELAA